MKKVLLTIGLSTLVLAGCTTVSQDRYNLTTQVPAGHSAGQVKQALIETGKARRWVITDAGQGRLMATQKVAGGISAKTEVKYSSNSYSFKLIDSTGLKQTPTSAHRRYNNWIHKWDDGVKEKLGISIKRK